jgi:peptidyl-prolyl cis-trans isomerase C
MNRTPAILSALAIASLAAACTQNAGTASTGTDTGKSATVAVVDGVAITRSFYDEYVRTVTTTPQAELTEKQRDGLLENLIRGNVLAKEAERSGAAATDKARATVELQRLDTLSRAASEHFLKDKTPTEQELRAEYEKRVASMDKSQYRASHILVQSQEEANQIIARLRAGGNFAQIAREKSQDTGSKDKGGDLDWFAASAMTPPFAEALVKLKKGETTASPVQTDFGFHVIRLVDVREATVPTYESVKEQLAQLVNNNKVNAWTAELLKKAKITKSL